MGAKNTSAGDVVLDGTGTGGLLNGTLIAKGLKRDLSDNSLGVNAGGTLALANPNVTNDGEFTHNGGDQVTALRGGSATLDDNKKTGGNTIASNSDTFNVHAWGDSTLRQGATPLQPPPNILNNGAADALTGYGLTFDSAVTTEDRTKVLAADAPTVRGGGTVAVGASSGVPSRTFRRR